jgi:cell division protein FtsA
VRGRTGRGADIVAAVDIGASKAICLIAQLVPSVDGAKIPEVVGVGLQGVDGERGTARETALRAAVDAAERMAGARIRSVRAAVPGRRLHCRRVAVELDLANGRASEEDVEECLRQGALASRGEGLVALRSAPVAFRIDGEIAAPDPAGLAGGVLEADVLGVSAQESAILNLESLIERAGLALAGCAPAPAAAGEAVLLDDERDLGVALVDIGAGSAGYAVYERGALADCGGVAIGAAHITRDLAQMFGAPLAAAERIKTLYGAALLGPGDEHRLVEVEQLGADREVLRVSRAEIAAIVAPRLEEIFELTLKQISANGRPALRRAVLTGGGSLLVGARETAERVLGMKARLGRPASLSGAPDAATGPQFSVCAGLIALAAREDAARNPAFEPLREASLTAARSLGANVARWLRENF